MIIIAISCVGGLPGVVLLGSIRDMIQIPN